MRALLFILVAVLATRAQAETLTLQADSYADFGQLLARQLDAKVSIAATLTLPEPARERSPALVIVHTIAGYQEANEGWHAEQFRKAGFATVTYRSVAARTAGASMSTWPSAVAEAYAALRALADHPRIDASRIAIVGFSFGGEVAHLSAFESLRAVLAPSRARFAAHLSYYPAGVYGIAAAPGAYTGAPVLMLLGEKDDNLPVTKVQAYLAYAKAAGFPPPVEVTVYPDAYHAWTVPSLGAAKFYPQYPSTRKCPYLLLRRGPPAVLIDGQERPIEPDIMQACLKEGRGYSMASDEAIRAQSTRDAVAFLVKALRPWPVR